jgi:hypothetical protein
MSTQVYVEFILSGLGLSNPADWWAERLIQTICSAKYKSTGKERNENESTRLL